MSIQTGLSKWLADWLGTNLVVMRLAGSFVLLAVALGSQVLNAQTLSIWLGATFAVGLALSAFTPAIKEQHRRATQAWDIALAAGFLVVAWASAAAVPPGEAARRAAPSAEAQASVAMPAASASSGPDVQRKPLVGQAASGSAMGKATGQTGGLGEAERRAGAEQQKESDPLTPVNALATILAVVLAVVTLVATKSATDAQAAVRVEVEKLEALTRATEQARVARIAMLSAMLQGEVLRLRDLVDFDDIALAASASKLLSFITPLTMLTYGLATSGHTSAPLHLDGLARNLSSLARLSPWQTLHPEVLTLHARDLLREAGQVVSGQIEQIRKGVGHPTPAEVELFERLSALGAAMRGA